MADIDPSGTTPKVPAERADLKTPEATGEPGTDRPGFDLGGAADASEADGAMPEGGPKGDPTLGDAHPSDGSQRTSHKATPA